MTPLKNDRLEALLSAKPFAELDAEERYFVTEAMDEAEYDRVHFLLKNAPPVLRDTPAPSPAIEGKLLAAMRQMKKEAVPPKRPSTIVRLLSARIPAWQAAAAIALVFGLHFLLGEKQPVLERTVTEYVHTTDTIYKEVAMPAEPTLEPPRRINVKPQELVSNTLDEPEIVAQTDSAAQSPDTFALTVSQPRGQSAREMEDLWQFFGEVH